jgi:hypothetical protein
MARATHYVGMCILLLSCRQHPKVVAPNPLVDS